MLHQRSAPSRRRRLVAGRSLFPLRLSVRERMSPPPLTTTAKPEAARGAAANGAATLGAIGGWREVSEALRRGARSTLATTTIAHTVQRPTGSDPVVVPMERCAARDDTWRAADFCHVNYPLVWAAASNLLGAAAALALDRGRGLFEWLSSSSSSSSSG